MVMRSLAAQMSHVWLDTPQKHTILTIAEQFATKVDSGLIKLKPDTSGIVSLTRQLFAYHRGDSEVRLDELFDQYATSTGKSQKRVSWLATFAAIITRWIGSTDGTFVYNDGEERQEKIVVVLFGVINGLVPFFGADAWLVGAALEGMGSTMSHF